MILPEKLDKWSVIQSFSTAVLLLFLVSGIYGFLHAEDRLIQAKKETPSTKVELVKVELKQPEPPPPPPEPPPEDLNEPPPPPNTIVLPDNAPPPPSLEPPAPVKVAAPSPSIAFQLPVVGATRTVEDPAQASGSAPRGQPRPKMFVPHYGTGAGEQPRPRYPREAELNGEEGVVTLRILTDDDHRVTSARILKSSGHSSLDREALSTVKRWRLPGNMPPDEYETTVEFVLR